MHEHAQAGIAQTFRGFQRMRGGSLAGMHQIGIWNGARHNGLMFLQEQDQPLRAEREATGRRRFAA